MRACAGLLVLLFASALAAEARVPLLELKQVEGKWAWHANGQIANDAAIERALLNHAAYRNDKTGWTGLDANAASGNALVIHVPELAPADLVVAMIESAAEARISRIFVGSPAAIATLPDASRAPDAAALDPAYLLIELPVDEGLQAAPMVPKESVGIHTDYDTDGDTGSYVVSIDARGRKVVADSATRTHLLIYAAMEPKAARQAKSELRTALREKVCAAAEDYISKAGADRIEKLRLGLSFRGYRPWLFYELAAHAAADVNARREKAGLKKLEIVWGWSNPVPPPPEQPPEVVQPFPKDEPEQPDPTEDPRIVEEPKDDANEDPSDKPNGDLAENPNDDPSDSESPHPKDGNSAVGLGGGVGGGGRGGKGGFAYRRARGGGGAANDRIRAALEWLKDHQNPEGHWSATTFGDDSTRKGTLKTYNLEFVNREEAKGDTGWEGTCDIGLTGLALLAYAGGGYDHREGDYRKTVRQAVMYLRKVQDNDGCFGTRDDDHFVYNHAICTMALAEIYGLSGDQVLKPTVDRAVQFILKAQNPGLGWRYGIQPGVNDSSVTGWMVLALKSAKMGGLEIDTEKCFSDASEWFKMMTADVDGYPKCGYDQPGGNNARLRSAQEYENNPSMDAIYIMSMLYMGKADLNDRTIKSLARGCAEKTCLPTWDHHKIDFYYWYYASLALYQVGGTSWNTWNKAVSTTLMDNQRGWHKTDKSNGHSTKEVIDEHGSWDAVDAWSSAGGRVYTTAMGALILQTPTRYERLEEKK